MLYDEHYGGGDPGPVASQAWFVKTARHMMRFIPPNKAILTLGAYGYDWNDSARKLASAMTFQDVMSAVRDAAVDGSGSHPLRLDSSLNPVGNVARSRFDRPRGSGISTASPRTTRSAGDALGAGGMAVWRLGSEDPAIWSRDREARASMRRSTI